MRLLSRFIFIPQKYEKYLSFFFMGILWPLFLIYVSFTLYYFNANPFSLNNIPWDVPAICLFALFFAPNRFRNMSFFMIILSIFEHSYYIENFSSLLFYSIFTVITYLTLTFRRGIPYSFFTLMSAFLALYGISLLIFGALTQLTNAHVTFDHLLSVWLNIFMIYPICFSLFHILLIKYNTTSHHNAL